MRLLKENKLNYTSFLESVEQLKRLQTGIYVKEKTKFPSDNKQINVISGGSVNIDLLTFSEKLNSLNSSEALLKAFDSEAKQLSFFKHLELFTVNDKTNECEPVNQKCNAEILSFVKSSVKNGVLDWISESKAPKILPWLQEGNNLSENLKCLVFPIFLNTKFSGILVALTKLRFLSEHSFEYRALSTILNLTFLRLQYFQLRKELNHTYSDYQILNSKLFNDYKFSAIGELASKSIEEIGSPLQVIISYADLLYKDNSDFESTAVDVIKTQVHSIKEILDRLAKFISKSDTNPKLYSCSVNTAIMEFYKIIESNLRADSYECVLDLEENIPSILSNYNNLNQILISSFSLINPLRGNGGGMIIQSRYNNESIIVKMHFTEALTNSSDEEKEFGINILNHLMERQEGEIKINSNPQEGTKLILSFPLKRKLRG